MTAAGSCQRSRDGRLFPGAGGSYGWAGEVTEWDLEYPEPSGSLGISPAARSASTCGSLGINMRPRHEIPPRPDSLTSVFDYTRPLFVFFWVLSLGAFAAEVFAFIDALRRPGPAFVAAGKQTKPLWLIILGVASVIGLGSIATGGFSPVSILPIAAFVAAAIYLTDVRPKVRQSGGGGGSSGPYGPW